MSAQTQPLQKLRNNFKNTQRSKPSSAGIIRPNGLRIEFFLHYLFNIFNILFLKG